MVKAGNNTEYTFCIIPLNMWLKWINLQCISTYYFTIITFAPKYFALTLNIFVVRIESLRYGDVRGHQSWYRKIRYGDVHGRENWYWYIGQGHIHGAPNWQLHRNGHWKVCPVSAPKHHNIHIRNLQQVNII
jgi:hypothetical protein